MNNNNYIIGVDIGGTTYSSTCFDINGNVIENSSTALICSSNSTENLLDNISNQIKGLFKERKVIGVGIASPGPLNAIEGEILETPNLILLKNCKIISELQKRLKIKCKLENDANLFTLGEFNQYQNQKDVFIGITLGTGLGFGLVINNKLFTGAHGMGGEYSISPFGNGNWESRISINALKKLSQIHLDNILDPKVIYKMASEQDKDALKIWDEFGKSIGIFLSHTINMLDPNAISIGGGLSNAYKLFKKSMLKNIEKYCPVYSHHKIDIYESHNKELSAKLGAASLVIDK